MNAAKFACAPECGCTLACSAPKSCFSAVDRELLDLVHDLAAAVVPLARIALGVLVGERRAHRLEHRAADEVLARDQLEPVAAGGAISSLDQPAISGSASRSARGASVSCDQRHQLPWLGCARSSRRGGAWRPPANGVSSHVLQDRYSFLLVDEARRKDEHVGVVVLARQRGDLGRPRDRRANVRVPVGRVGHAEPGAAQQHSRAPPRRSTRARERVRVVGIVGGLGAEWCRGRRLVPERPAARLEQPFLELEAGVVGGDGNDFGHPALMYE